MSTFANFDLRLIVNDDLENGSLNDDIEICPHLKEAVKMNKLKKNLKNGSTNFVDAQCRTCVSQAEGIQETPDLTDGDNITSEKETVRPQIWLCLACGKLHCGRYDKKHAIEHFEENKSHTVAMKLDMTETWCYSCDKPVIASAEKNQVINQARNFISKVFKSDNNIKASDHVLPKNDVKTRYQTAAPGLANLGNTCFFNSVMQVVVATSVLHDILQPDSPYQKYPLIKAERCPAAEAEEVGPLTDAFKKFLKIMWEQKGGMVTPRELFSEIARKWQQFRGWRQQDSQELMRFMFDGIKCEESEINMIVRKYTERKIANGMFKYLFQFIKKIQSHETKEEITTEDNELPKEQDDSSSEKSLQQKPESFIDICFGGKLVSLIVCDTCKNESYSYEEFLDVSLPIKSPFGEDQNKGSKQIFSGAKKMLTNYFSSKSRNNDNTSPHESPTDDSSRSGDDDSSDDGSEEDGEFEDSNRDDDSENGIGIATISKDRRKRIKMLLREPARSGRSTPNSAKDITLVDCLASFMKVEALDGENLFACENCWKSQNPSVEPSNNGISGDSVVVEQSNDISIEKSDQIGNHVEPHDSLGTQLGEEIFPAMVDDTSFSETTPNDTADPTTIDDSQPSEPAPMNTSSDDQHSSPETTPESSSNAHISSETTPESSSSAHPMMNDAPLLSETTNDLPLDTSDANDDSNDQAADQLSSTNYTNNDLESPSVNIMMPSAMPKLSNQESQPHPQKYILRKAYKRYLFDSLPPVLVFHLKRFQQVGGRFSVSMKKIDDFVSFEEEIDVRDFIVPPESEGEEMEDEDDESGSELPYESRNTKYRLYGVVVHLGSLYNGHYIAYVLSRNIVPMREQYGIPYLSDDDYKEVEKISETVGEGQRQWIYCSDGSVRAVNVDEVLKSMAYLLFYEQVQ
ncbi:43884_t:CDS:2 [Gigaspora margarita]|uniref:Ubiquitin carboxyl-terminal hydrolase n=1 Tax=Gigaspora margarita TaxID=4874 RepID=A0ABN7V362_GIGMA|nr:43884_t:CDS:2 [Gigaspora margarita]